MDDEDDLAKNLRDLVSRYKTLWKIAGQFDFGYQVNYPLDSKHPLRRTGINLILNTCAYTVDELVEGPRPSDYE
jgi:hypothetical protein